jgi:Uma2 family endonuclease
MAQVSIASDLVSVANYLAGENDGQWKHEFHNGHVFAMAGASDNHNKIAGDVFSFINLALKSDCSAYSGDMKLRIEDAQDTCYFYPDTFVSCEPDRDPYFRTDAVLVIEVLSPSTQRHDRYEKFSAYKKLRSLSEYVLIEQESPKVEVFRRNNGWEREAFRRGETITLESINQTLTFEQIYRRVSFSAATGT